jgi:hypothetical protein
MLRRSVIVTGPVAQPGRVPDFYLKEEIRLSRVRIPTGPHDFSFESITLIEIADVISSENKWQEKVSIDLFYRGNLSNYSERLLEVRLHVTRMKGA